MLLQVRGRDSWSETDILTNKHTHSQNFHHSSSHTIRTSTFNEWISSIRCSVLSHNENDPTREAYDRLYYIYFLYCKYISIILPLVYGSLPVNSGIHAISQIMAVSGSDDIKNCFEFIMTIIVAVTRLFHCLTRSLCSRKTSIQWSFSLIRQMEGTLAMNTYISWCNWINLIVVKIRCNNQIVSVRGSRRHFGTFRTICWCENYEMTVFLFVVHFFYSSKSKEPLIIMKSTTIACHDCLSLTPKIKSWFWLISAVVASIGSQTATKFHGIESPIAVVGWFVCRGWHSEYRSIPLPPYLSILLHPDRLR